MKISGSVLRMRISETGTDLSNLKAGILDVFVTYCGKELADVKGI